MEGTIFNLQRFSLHDGPGIRTTVFLKGCSLRCRWCHNPESQSFETERRYFRERCWKCGRCVVECPQQALKLQNEQIVYDTERCVKCWYCVQICPSQAMQTAGKKVSAQEVLKEVKRDIPFYRSSGGGVTFSGGEPLQQPQFLSELLRLAKEEGLHTAVDTAGDVDFSVIESVLPNTDLFLYDCKLIDEACHKETTGVSNRRILENLIQLSATDAEVLIRVPLVPGFNANATSIEKIAVFLAEKTRFRDIELLPYHGIGESKYETLGLTYSLNDVCAPTEDELERYRAICRSYGLRPKDKGVKI